MIGLTIVLIAVGLPLALLAATYIKARWQERRYRKRTEEHRRKVKSHWHP